MKAPIIWYQALVLQELSAFSSFNFCVPSRPRALTKVKGQHMVGPLKGPKEESQRIDRLRRRQGGASPR